jgi:hypothetical protein
MFTLFNKNKIFIDASLRNYIRTSINQSIQKYIKNDDKNHLKKNSICDLNGLDKINKETIVGIDGLEINNKLFNKIELFGILLFLSIPTFIHFLYLKK